MTQYKEHCSNTSLTSFKLDVLFLSQTSGPSPGKSNSQVEFLSEKALTNQDGLSELMT
jgi:hypothetical protein